MRCLKSGLEQQRFYNNDPNCLGFPLLLELPFKELVFSALGTHSTKLGL